MKDYVWDMLNIDAVDVADLTEEELEDYVDWATAKIEENNPEVEVPYMG